MIKKKYIFTTFSSVFISLLFLIIKNIFGINFDYHPDSVHYLNDSNFLSSQIYQDPSSLIGKLYYVYVDLLKSNLFAIIALNILYFSIIYNILFKFISIKFNSKRKRYKIFFILLCSDLYLLHFSTTPLKETIILFFLVIGVNYQYNNRNYLFYTTLITGLLFRPISILYNFYAIKINLKSYFFIFILIIIIYNFPLDIIQNQFEASSTTSLHSRGFDKIPNFVEYGALGLIYRFILWPFIFYSGIFVLISPSFEYLFLIPGTLVKVFMILKYSSLKIIILLLMISGIFASIAPGFTSYTRYSYPLLFITMLLVFSDKYILQSIKKN